MKRLMMSIILLGVIGSPVVQADDVPQSCSATSCVTASVELAAACGPGSATVRVCAATVSWQASQSSELPAGAMAVERRAFVCIGEGRPCQPTEEQSQCVWANYLGCGESGQISTGFVVPVPESGCVQVAIFADVRASEVDPSAAQLLSDLPVLAQVSDWGIDAFNVCA